METVRNTAFGYQTNHLIHHITTTGHYETDIARTVQYHCCSFYKVFRSFLHGNTSQESNDLFARILLRNNILYLL